MHVRMTLRLRNTAYIVDAASKGILCECGSESVLKAAIVCAENAANRMAVCTGK